MLFTDSTHIKANANKRKFESIKVEKKPSEFIDELNEDVNKEREKHDKKPLKPKDAKLEEKEIKQSKTDPESGF
ncbi:MAG: hypothetical protein WC155_00900 [Candidatus Cloacimonadales bacterium]